MVVENTNTLISDIVTLSGPGIILWDRGQAFLERNRSQVFLR